MTWVMGLPVRFYAVWTMFARFIRIKGSTAQMASQLREKLCGEPSTIIRKSVKSTWLMVSAQVLCLSLVICPSILPTTLLLVPWEVYFTDPTYQQAGRPGQPAARVYFADQNKLISVIAENIPQPNGIVLSKTKNPSLFLQTTAVSIALLSPTMVPAAAPAVFAILSAGLDGMAQDCMGNVFATVHTDQKLSILSPQGQILQEIALPANATNVTFGGADGKTIYITTAGRLFRVNVQAPGIGSL